MFCYIRRDLSTYLQLSLCLSALLNWGQQFSSPSVSLTLTVPDIQEIQTGAAVVTYQQKFSLQTGAASILLHGPSALGGRVRSPQAPPCPHQSPSLRIPMAPPVERQKPSIFVSLHEDPTPKIYCLLIFFKSIFFSIVFCMFIKDFCFLCAHFQVVGDF